MYDIYVCIDVYCPRVCVYTKKKYSCADFDLMTPLEAQDLTFKLMIFSEKFVVICSFLAAFICVLKKESSVMTSGYL